MEDGSGSGGYAKEMSSGYKEAEVSVFLCYSVILLYQYFIILLFYNYMTLLIF